MSFSKSIFWDLTGTFYGKIVNFLISIFLARILTPEEFGLVGMVLVIISIAEIYIDMGFGSALIQKPNVDNKLFSSVFWLNIIMGALLTAIVFLLSPIISSFYKIDLIESLSRSLSFVFIIGSLGIIQNIRLTRKMNFKSLALAHAVSITISGAVGIVLAMLNFGVWALVFQQLLTRVTLVINLWIIEKWKPEFYLSLNDIQSIWGFSSKRFLTLFLRSIFRKLDTLIIAKLFEPATLGFYTRSRSLTDIIIVNTSGSLNKVFFPLVSKHQENHAELKKIYSKSLLLIGYVSVCISSLLFISAKEIIVLFFSEKWLNSVPFFAIMVLADGFTKPIGTLMLNLILGLGHAGTEFKLLLIKRSLWLIPILILYSYGITVFLYSSIVHSIIVFLIDSYSVTKHFNITFYENGFKLVYFILIASISVVLTYFTPSTSHLAFDLIIKTFVFLVLYNIGVFLFIPAPINYFLNKIKLMNANR